MTTESQDARRGIHRRGVGGKPASSKKEGWGCDGVEREIGGREGHSGGFCSAACLRSCIAMASVGAQSSNVRAQ